MAKKHHKKNKEEEYVLSPFGCAVCAAMDAELIEDYEDGRMDVFWEKFCNLMDMHGYIKGKKKK